MRVFIILITLYGCFACQKKNRNNDTTNSRQVSSRTIQSYRNVLGGYNLVWEDEFDSTAINTTRWKYRIGISQQSYQLAKNIVIDTTGTGKMKIILKKENYGEKKYTGGGIITKIPSSYGYYEVRAKLDGGYGWHEAFWAAGLSGFDDSVPLFNDTTGQLEIDCFEHYGSFDNHYFTYGAIEWKPYHGNINRDFKRTTADLVNNYNKYGFEYTPDYLNYYFNGKLLKTVDLREKPKHDLYLWLSCIATDANADSTGIVEFDYIRAYKLPSTAYARKRAPFLNQLDSLRGPKQSKGTYIWIQAENFTVKNNWIVERDTDGTIILRGLSSYNSSRGSRELTASTNIQVSKAGTYNLWVRSKDFTSSLGKRKFLVKVNEVASSTLFGTHGQEGYAWQYGGNFRLTFGINRLELYDAYQYFARCDKILFTTDASFTPSGIGAPTNAKHR